MAKDKGDAVVFSVTTRFETLARRPGGLRREEALERAQSSVEEAAPDFQAWVERELQALMTAAELCDPQAKDIKERAESVALYARRVRDVGTTMGYELLTFVADRLCEMLEAVEAGAEYRRDLVDLHIEALLLSRQERYRHMRPDEVPELSSGLTRMANVLSPPIAK